MEKPKEKQTRIIQFPSLRFDLGPEIEPMDLDNARLDEIQKSLDDIEKLMGFLRNEIMLIRMRMENE